MEIVAELPHTAVALQSEATSRSGGLLPEQWTKGPVDQWTSQIHGMLSPWSERRVEHHYSPRALCVKDLGLVAECDWRPALQLLHLLTM